MEMNKLKEEHILDLLIFKKYIINWGLKQVKKESNYTVYNESIKSNLKGVGFKQSITN